MALKLITTGGTIATVNVEGGARTRAALAGAQVAGLVDHAQDIDVEDVSISPSWALTAPDMMRVAMIARDAARTGKWSGVIVTHGTSTLEYTAFLAELVNDSDIPVVFTGAMRIASAADADGPRNLSDAMRVAAHKLSRGHRALVVFAGHVIAARAAWKLRRDQVDAFISVGRRAGSVGRSGVRMPDSPPPSLALKGKLEPRVGLVKVYPGLSPAALEAGLGHDSRGLVLEALPGAGGVPPHLHEVLRSIAQRMPAVIASRAPDGRVPTPPSGGTGEPLANMNLLSAGDLTSEKAWLLLMACLGESESTRQARELFERYVSSG